MSSSKLRCAALAAWCLVAATVTPVVAQPSTAETGTRFVRIATGSPGGVYYPLGGAICRFFNLASDRHGLRCTAEPSAGSVENLAALRAGRIEVAIVQSDVQADARRAKGRTRPFDGMRALFSAHAEAFTLVAHGDSRIASVADLAGKRVAVGERGAGVRVMADAVLAAFDMPERRLGRALALSPVAQNREFCARRIDAFVYVAGHPNGLIQDATRCGGSLVAIGGDGIRALLARRPEYVATVVPGGLYAGQAGDVPTIGTTATVVTTSRLSARAATEIVRAVFDELDAFRQMHPAFADLRPEDMVSRGNTAPLHRAAAAYYRARGWLN
ncbi:MAG: TAXI family TRAP transporter solute-binding subunit [Alphaproteobacteria bacterium]